MHIIPNFSFIILTGLLTTGSDGKAPTSPGCATSELDLVFVMDSSADVTHDDLERSKGFIRRMILPFDINPVATRVSTITYGNTAQILNDLDDISVALTDFDEPFGTWEVIHILNNSVPMGGKRRTGQALRLACDEVLKFKNPETRRNVPAVVVIISAGYSEDDIPSDLSCKEDKSADVTIVGVSTDRRGAVIFGSEHIDRSFEINDRAMDSTEKKIFATICNETIWNLSLAEQDLVFLLDRSNVIPAEDLKFLKRWIWEISHRFALGRNFTRVGILEFGGGVSSEMTDLTANLDDLREFVDAIRYYPSANGVGNLTEILRHVALDTFRDEGDDIRLNLHRNLIIITTSPLRITREAEITARDLMLGGVNIFVVTVGMHGSSSLMQAISSKPYTSHIISTENYQELITSRKRMVRSLRDEVFIKYSGSLLELHFIVGGLASRADQIRAADLMKRISDLYLIGQHYTRVYITTGLEELGYAGEVKSGVFKVISSNDYQEPVDIIASVKAILNRETPSKKVIVIITPEVIRDATVWGAMSGANKRNGYIYSFGFTSGGLEWKYDSSGETELQELGNDYRPAADLLVDKISSDTTQDCRVAELDLQFLMDGSSSIQEDDFKLAKDWIESLISQFNVGQYTTRVGIDQYSGEPGTEFHMVDFNGKVPVLQAVTDIDQKTGLTKTGFAINYTLANSIIPSAGARSEVRQIFLVLTDGKSRDSVSYAAQRAHERPQLTTYAVGVADADVDELREIASEPKEQHVFQAENFNEMSGLKDVIGTSICKTAIENITEADFNEVDLIVLFEDSTTLMSKQLYPYLIQFIMRLAEKAAENYSSRVAVVKFSTEPSVIQQFTRNLTLVYQELINNKLESDQSQVNLGLALSFVKEMFGETPGRKHVKKILVTIVTNPITDKVIGEVTGLTKQGVNIFGISVGRCSSLTYLKQIASNPDYFFVIDRTHHLVQVEPSLRRYIREIPSAPPYVCDLKMDIAFVIDESAASTTEDFNEILSFIADISKRLVFGDNGSRLFITQLESDRSSYKVKSFTEEITPGDISRLVHMNDTLIDAANALGIIGAIAFQDEPRRNIPKFVVTITGASTAAAMDSEVVAESDAKLFTIAVGNTDVARTDVKSDILTLSSFDELAMVNLDIAKAICDGYDMISSLDLPSSSGVKLIKLDGMPPRYRVTGKSRVRGQVSHIFPNGFPSQPIKLTASIKMGKRASSAHSWNIYELTDQRGRTEFSVTIDGKMKNIKLFRKGRPGATVTFSGGLVNSFFTKTWHLLELVLTDSTAIRPFEAFQSLPDNGQVRIGKLSNSRKSTAFDLERLDISCGLGTDLNNSLESCTAVKDLEFTKPNKSPNPTATPGSSESGVATETLVEIPKQECNCTAGPPGSPGQKGERGVPGANGIDGKVGPVGPRGFKGSPGASVNIQSGIGQVGPPGPPGPRGPPGLPGLISSGNNLANVRNQKAFTMEATDARMTLIAQDECRAMINSAVPRIVMSILERELSSERFRGKKGDKGSQGETGRTGDKGHAGESGPRGKIGLPGMRGITGHEGPRGPKGNTGERGETGYGIPGINGVKGPRGYPGQSIRGDPGRKGERGDRGVAGPAGHRGLRGPAGINGRCEHHTCYNAALRFVSESMRGRENGVD